MSPGSVSGSESSIVNDDDDEDEPETPAARRRPEKEYAAGKTYMLFMVLRGAAYVACTSSVAEHLADSYVYRYARMKGFAGTAAVEEEEAQNPSLVQARLYHLEG